MEEVKNPRKHTKAVVIIIIILVLLAAVLAILNADSLIEKQQMQSDATFQIIVGGEKTIVTMEDLAALSPKEIEANYKKSGKDPEIKRYTGVSFAALLEYKKIDPSPYKAVSFTAADGYATALPIEDALDIENCFIIIAEEGKPLGTKADGGSGPYQMILPKDQFSQRWCKFLMEVEFK